MKRKITDEKVACLNADLNSEDWEDVLGCHDVEKAFELFWNKLYCYFDKHIPYSKSIDRKKREAPLDYCWYTPIYKKAKLFV